MDKSTERLLSQMAKQIKVLEQCNAERDAQVEQLQCKLHQITTKLEEFSYMPDTFAESQLIRSLCLATPAQCSEEVKAQVVEEFKSNYKLPCDVMLFPATTFKKGVSLSTLIVGMKIRDEADSQIRQWTFLKCGHTSDCTYYGVVPASACPCNCEQLHQKAKAGAL